MNVQKEVWKLKRRKEIVLQLLNKTVMTARLEALNQVYCKAIHRKFCYEVIHFISYIFSFLKR